MSERGPLVMCGICRRRVAALAVRHWLLGHFELFSITTGNTGGDTGFLWAPKSGAVGSMQVPCCSLCVVATVETVGVLDSGLGLSEL